MKRPSWRRTAAAFAATALTSILAHEAAVAQHHRNHSFDLDPASAVVCLDGATFDGEPTHDDALNLLMTGEVWNATGTVQIAVGDNHTFTMVGEVYTFTVPYPVGTFNVGDLITLSVTDVTGTFFGPQGDVATANVGDCLLFPPVPFAPGWGLALLALLLVVAGALLAAKRDRIRAGGLRAGLFALLLVGSAAAAEAGGGPLFDKFFDPLEIGPGGTSILTFVIDNTGGGPVSDLAFTDTLPAGVTIADPPLASSNCGFPTLSAPAGGTTITFSGGQVGGGKICTVKLSVRSATTGTHMNVSGDLTSSAGNSGSASADLTVKIDRPGFFKVFSPSTVALGDRSTLTFTIDNLANASPAALLDFTDVLPVGMVIADPANVDTDCGTPPFVVPEITATPGTSVIDFFVFGSVAFPAVPALDSCFVAVDVRTTGGVDLHNLSGGLDATVSSVLRSGGRATDTLTSTVTTLGLRKSFLDDPVPPSETVKLEFRIDNRDRTSTATGIGFTDDLDFTPSMGITLGGGPTPSPPCGVGSTLTLAAGDVLTLSGGTLPAQGFCEFTVTLDIPPGETIGAFDNTTSAVTGTVDGDAVVGNVAVDTLFISPTPKLEKEFLDAMTDAPDPVVAAGDDVKIRFKVTNTSLVGGATDITFQDILTDILPFPISATLPTAPCGAGSSLLLTSCGTDCQQILLDSGVLGVGGMCTFDVTLTLPAGLAGGTYLNVTGPISATVDGGTRIGAPASDTLDVAAAPQLAKTFFGSPVQPGGQVTVEFTLEHDVGAPGDATGITFTDNLGSTGIAGLRAAAGELPLTDVCGSGNGTLTGSAGDTLLTFSGGTLMPGEECTFTVLLDVPGSAPGGTRTNKTSGVSATVSGLATTSLPAEADLVIAQVVFTKAFGKDVVLPGGSVSLEFTLTNLAPVAATGISFSDNLDAFIEFATASGLPAAGFCGPGSTLIGTSFLSMFSGSLAAAGSPGDSCTFSVTVDVPAGAIDGLYINATSNLSVTVGSPTILPPAVDSLTVTSDLLFLRKSFTTDPVAPGETVNLRFTIENLDPDDVISSIAFSDNLDAALSGLKALGLPVAGCGSMATTADGGSTIDFAGGSVAGGASCFFDVTVQVPALAAVGTAPLNTTSGISGLLGGLPVSGAPASDTLKISSLDFSKAFDGPTVPGGSPKLTFTIKNLSATSSASDLSFTDDLDATLSGLEAVSLPAAPCGVGSSIAGTSFLTFSGGSLPPGGTCSIEVTLAVPAGAAAPATYPNTSGNLRKAGLPAADPATDDLVVESLPTLIFTKAFDGPTVPGGSPKLTFSITNPSGSFGVSDLAFTDDLGLTLTGLTATVLPATPCGAGSSITGPSVLTFSGGSLAAGGSCSFEVTLSVPAGAVPATYPNTTSDLTSLGIIVVAAPATDDLVVQALPTLVFTKAFDGPTVPGGSPKLTFSITNPSLSFGVSDLSFTDDLGLTLTGLTAAVLPAMPCGAGSSITGPSVLTFSGGSLPPGGFCSFEVTLSVPAGAAPGTYPNTTSDLISLGVVVVAAPATDDLEIEPSPTFAKAFSPSTIGETFESTLTFTIDNSASALAATGLAFTDLLPFDLELSADPMVTNTCGGTVTADPSGVSVELSGGSVAAMGTCTISVKVLGVSEGTFVNVTGDLTSSLGNSGTATDTLTVAPCLADDGINLTIAGEVFLVPATREVCNTITVEEHTLVLGPNGVLKLRAGVEVIFPATGFEVGQGGVLIIEIDPSLIP